MPSSTSSHQFDLIIKNGSCVLPDSEGVNLQITSCDIGVRDGKIAAIGNLQNASAIEVFDSKGLHVLPGMIDSQVHFREPGLTHKEDLESGSRAAALGGVTAFFEMPNTKPATTTVELFEQKLKLAAGRCHTNYAFYAGASAENVDQLATLEQLPGCAGIKIFMGSSTGTLLVDQEEVLREIFRKTKRRLILHAEDEARLKSRKHIAESSHDVHDHPNWRDVESAFIATEKAVKLAQELNRQVHILHVTSKKEAEFLAAHKQWATFELPPQHLTLFAPDCYDKLGTLAQMNPPIRTRDHLEGLWNSIANNAADVLGSDHAPHTREEKRQQYPASPSGMPGVQTILPLMLNHVHHGRLSLTKLVALLGENVRRVFGVHQKGRLAIGLDADFTIVDLKKIQTIESSWLASRCGWSPFEGMEINGWPTHSILGGKFILQDGSLTLEHAGQAVRFDHEIKK